MTVRGWRWSSGETGWVKDGWFGVMIKFGYDVVDKGVDWEHVRSTDEFACRQATVLAASFTI